MGKFKIQDIVKKKQEKLSLLEKAKQKMDMIKMLTQLKVKGLGNFGLREIYGTFKFGVNGYISGKPTLLHKLVLKELIVFGLTDKRDQDIKERIVEITNKEPSAINEADITYMREVFYPYVKASYEAQAGVLFKDGFLSFDDVVIPSDKEAESNFHKMKDAKRGHIR